MNEWAWVRQYRSHRRSTITRNFTLSDQQVAPATRDEVGQHEFWPLAALLALIVLLIEWTVYQRRLMVRTVLRPALRRRAAG